MTAERRLCEADGRIDPEIGPNESPQRCPAKRSRAAILTPEACVPDGVAAPSADGTAGPAHDRDALAVRGPGAQRAKPSVADDHHIRDGREAAGPSRRPEVEVLGPVSASETTAGRHHVGAGSARLRRARRRSRRRSRRGPPRPSIHRCRRNRLGPVPSTTPSRPATIATVGVAAIEAENDLSHGRQPPVRTARAGRSSTRATRRRVRSTSVQMDRRRSREAGIEQVVG